MGAKKKPAMDSPPIGYNAGMGTTMPTRRTWLRLTLACVFLATAVLVTVLAIMIPELRRASRQRVAVNSITQLGGKVLYDWQLNGTSGPTTLRDFVREFLGDPNIYAEVEHVDLSGTAASDETLSLVEGFYGMRWLLVGNTAITDDGIKELSRKLPDCKIRR